MKIDFENSKIYVRPGFTDLRKGCGGLVAVVSHEMNLDALSNAVFLFCNKKRKLLKVLFWDKTGFWLAQKHLEKSTWPWPRTSEAAREISENELTMLLSGIDFWHAHKELKYEKVF